MFRAINYYSYIFIATTSQFVGEAIQTLKLCFLVYIRNMLIHVFLDFHVASLLASDEGRILLIRSTDRRGGVYPKDAGPYKS